jgi:hypothetical protein
MRHLRALATAAAILAAATAAPAADAGVKAGALTCTQKSATNYVLYSAVGFDCVYEPAGKGSAERYAGDIDMLGVDLSYTRDQQLVWLVFAPSSDVAAGALGGDYVGASVDAAVGLGVGAKVLVGGDADAFTLQPVSLSGSRGVGAAVGIERFRLSYGGPRA